MQLWEVSEEATGYMVSTEVIDLYRLGKFRYVACHVIVWKFAFLFMTFEWFKLKWEILVRIRFSIWPFFGLEPLLFSMNKNVSFLLLSPQKLGRWHFHRGSMRYFFLCGPWGLHQHSMRQIDYKMFAFVFVIMQRCEHPAVPAHLLLSPWIPGAGHMHSKCLPNTFRKCLIHPSFL